MSILATILCRRITLLTALSFFVAGLATAQVEDSALQMVRKVGLGQNLGRMAYVLAKNTVTYKVLVRNVGAIKADELLSFELAIEVPLLQPQWNANLAKAWRPLMAPSEFESIAAERGKSPYAKKFASLQDRAGAEMKADSEKLLTALVAKTLGNALEKSISHN